MASNPWDEYVEDAYEEYCDQFDRCISRTKSSKYPMWNNRRVKDMETNHIISALAWCDRKYAEMITNYKIAHYSLEGFYFNNITERFPEYRNLVAELTRRRP